MKSVDLHAHGWMKCKQRSENRHSKKIFKFRRRFIRLVSEPQFWTKNQDKKRVIFRFRY